MKFTNDTAGHYLVPVISWVCERVGKFVTVTFFLFGSANDRDLVCSVNNRTGSQFVGYLVGCSINQAYLVLRLCFYAVLTGSLKCDLTRFLKTIQLLLSVLNVLAIAIF